MNGGRRARQIVYLIHLQKYGINQIVPNQLEMPVVQQMKDVSLLPREIVIEADYSVALFEQPFTKMGTQESGPPGDKNPHSVKGIVRHASIILFFTSHAKQVSTVFSLHPSH
jgi:hypothetical protein